VLSWSQALLLGAGLLGAAAVLRRGPDRLGFAVDYLREAAGLCALYAAWQVVLDHLVVHTAGAVGHGRWVERVERDLHWPSEAWFQRPFLHHPILGRASDVYYGAAHFTVMGICLAWLFARHRDAYRRARGRLVLVTMAAALIQAVPVAPPRLVAGAGVVDVARRLGQSVYNPGGLSDPGQLIAMPSVHVAWAGLVALSVVQATRSRGRWSGPLHLVVTVAVVVGTGNHWWLDGAAALALVALAVPGEAALSRLTAAAAPVLAPVVSPWWRAPGGARRWPGAGPTRPLPLPGRSRDPSTRPAGAAPPGGPRSTPPDPAWPGPRPGP
jgi:hypothetical protein